MAEVAAYFLRLASFHSSLGHPGSGAARKVEVKLVSQGSNNPNSVYATRTERWELMLSVIR